MSGRGGQLRGRAARLARLMPSTGPTSPARTPFVLLVVLLLGGGLITLLLLNSSLNEGSFRLSELKKQTTDLTDEQQALQQEVDNLSAPDALQSRARELGMVPGGSPAFLNPDGTVSGVPSEADAQADALPPADPSAMEATPPVAPPASPAAPTPPPAAGAPASPFAPADVSAIAATPPGPGQTPGTPTPTTSGR